MFATYDNDDVYSESNDNNNFTHKSSVVISVQEPVKNEEIKPEIKPEINPFFAIVARCCILGRHSKVETTTETPHDLTKNEIKVLNINRNPSIRTNKNRNPSMRTNITQHFGMPLPKEVDSCGSPVDPYRGRINPAIGWF